MSRSPGHRKWPDHKVEERTPNVRRQVAVGGEIVADSTGVVTVEEDDHPDRHYFPRADVKPGVLERTATTSECPFKGAASYFSVIAGDTRLDDAAWSYEDPYEEHISLKDRIAFDCDKFPEMEIREAG